MTLRIPSAALWISLIAIAAVGGYLLGRHQGNDAQTAAMPATSVAAKPPPSQVTDAAEVASLEDLRQKSKKSTKLVLALAKVCDKSARFEGSPFDGEYYDDCFAEDVAPVRDDNEDAVHRVLSDLSDDVGSDCRRAIRSAQAETGLSLLEQTLEPAISSCRREADGS